MSEQEVTISDSKPRKTKKEILIAFHNFLKSHIPIIDWLPKYKWKEFIISDLSAGLTLGSLEVAQGLAFALLAHASPVMGLYTSCFTTLIYSLFGTAVYSSFGPVAVTSMLTGYAVDTYEGSEYTNDELIVVITFIVGTVYIIALIMRFYVITKLFTKHLLSGYILACSLQIVLQTFRIILGIKAKQAKGFFNFIFNTYYICKEMPNVNFATLGLSSCILLVLTLNFLVFKPLMAKCTKIIFPIEITIIIIVTTLSYLLEFNRLGVALVGYVPTGFPQPALPRFDAIPEIWSQAFEIGFINLATTVSMTIMFNPDIRYNQELFAMGITNLICCTLQTIPFGNSMIRTIVAKSIGVKTLLCSVIASILVMFSILFMGPLFQPLPLCALASIVVFALTILIINTLKELPKLFKAGWESSIIWTVTLLVTLFISIPLGLIIGCILSLRQMLSAQEKKNDDDSPQTPDKPDN